MTELLLEYLLHDGFIDNWLVAGPQAIPVPDLDRFGGDDSQLQIARFHPRWLSAIHQPPVELGTFQIGDADLTWRFSKCLDDHFVDLSAFWPTCHHLRSWAYAQIESPSEQETTFVLTTNGPADVWLNREHVHRQEHLYHQDPHSVSFQGALREGRNEVLVRFEVTAVRACPYVMALQITGVPAHNLSVKLPTWHTNIPRRHKLERLYPEIHLEREISVGGGDIYLRWDDPLDETGHVDFWAQDAQEHIRVAGALETYPGERYVVGSSQAILEEGPHRIVLLPPAAAIERYDIRYQEYLPFHVLDTTFSQAPYGTYEERQREALKDAARREQDLYATIATL
jgi:hypothetical protein